MLAKWLLSGLTSGRPTTKYPFKDSTSTEGLKSNVLPIISNAPDLQTCLQLERNCPTKAITMTMQDGQPVLQLDQAACIGCGRCISLKQNGCIQWSPSVDIASSLHESLLEQASVLGAMLHGDKYV